MKETCLLLDIHANALISPDVLNITLTVLAEHAHQEKLPLIMYVLAQLFNSVHNTDITANVFPVKVDIEH